MIDAWKDLYEDCLSVERDCRKQIKEHQKAILRLQKDMEENRKFFEKNFDLPLDFRWSMCYTIIVPREMVL